MSRYRPPRPKQSAYITPEGAQVLRDELHALWVVERPRVTQEVADAAAQGDRSENAEYIYGKKRLREIDRRVRFLQKRLDAVVIVSEPPSDPERVFFGAWVTLEDEDGQEVEYRIVGPDEFDVSAGKISMDSPVGKALFGKRLDDEVIIKRPKGDWVCTVTAIRYETA
ncbi:MAG: transcription elongation factor GreB [Haliangiales bacterium]